MNKFLTAEQTELVKTMRKFIAGFKAAKGTNPPRIVLDQRNFAMYKTMRNKKRSFPDALADVDIDASSGQFEGVPVEGTKKERLYQEQVGI